MTATKLQSVYATANGNPLTSTVFAIAPTQPGSCLVLCLLNFGTTASATSLTVTSCILTLKLADNHPGPPAMQG